MKQPSEFTPLVRASGPYMGLFDTFQSWPEGEYNPGWQPPADYAMGADGQPLPLFAVHAPYPDEVGSGWAWTEAHGWEAAVADPAGPGGWRPATDAERFQRAVDARIAALKAEVETYIDTSIRPITRDMLRDGVLDDETADDVRAFIAMCYTEANSVIDAIEAASAIDNVDDPAPVWPIFGGA